MFNRVAFVTGASRGIGRAIALTLCRGRLRHRGRFPGDRKERGSGGGNPRLQRRGNDRNLDVTSLRLRQSRLRQGAER